MPEPTEDLWPSDLTAAVVDPEPVAFLKQQARLLSGKTNGRIEGVVREDTVGGTVYYSLYLRSVTPDDYAFKVLYVAHPVTTGAFDPSPWPFTVEDSFGGGPMQVFKLDEFKKWLQHVLSSEKVKTVIGNLLRNADDEPV